STAGARNIISGNSQNGVLIENAVAFFGLTAAANNNVIEGNYIGTQVNGTTALGNARSGVNIVYDPSGDATGPTSTSGNTIGGTAAGAGNVIAGNGVSGIYLRNARATGNLIQGNYVGLDASGSHALGNGNDSITIDIAPGNTVGGTTAGAGNVLAAA